MDKTIEVAFFKAFEFGGFVDRCIDYVQRKYDWDFKYDSTHETTLSEQAGRLWYVELPKTIKAGFEAFDSRVIETPHSPLIDEIERNLQDCTNDIERDNYIFSLIKPFARLSEIINPIAKIDRLKDSISEYEKDIEYLSKANPDEQLRNAAGEAAGTAKEQLEACKKEIERLKWQVERTNEISSLFVGLIGGFGFEKGSVEYCLGAMCSTMRHYSDRLFAMLIQHGIDLKEYQRKAGVYLKRNWLITDIDFYVGSMELAKYYLDKIGHNEQHQTPRSTKSDERRTPGPLNDGNAQQDNSHFTTAFNKEQLTTIFERLKTGLYLHADSVLDDWLIVCGAETANKPVNKINWVTDQQDLAWLIHSLFEDLNAWEITPNCFTIKGKKPNTNSMKNVVSKVLTEKIPKPKAFDDLEELLKV